MALLPGWTKTRQIFSTQQLLSGLSLIQSQTISSLPSGVLEAALGLSPSFFTWSIKRELLEVLNSSHILLSFRPESDPAVLLCWVESEADLTAIHNAAKVTLACDDEDCDENISGNQWLLYHSQPGVCKWVLEERADTSGLWALPRHHGGTQEHQFQGQIKIAQQNYLKLVSFSLVTQYPWLWQT